MSIDCTNMASFSALFPFVLFLASATSATAHRHFPRQPSPAVLTRSSTPPTEADILALINETLRNTNTPSAQIAITRNGTVVWSRAFGNAYLEPPQVAAEPETLYWLASVTKTITSVLTARLVDEGKLDLDRDINDYLGWSVRNPAFPDIPITPRLLATHTSSIRDGSIWSDQFSYKGGDPFVSLADAVKNEFHTGGAWNAPMNYHDYKPGGAFDYSNIGVALLGHVCEAIAQEEYVPVATSRVLEPLGIHERSFWFYKDLPKLGIDLRPDVAMPYSWHDFSKDKKSHRPPTGAGVHVPKGWYGYPDIPAGMLRTSAASLARVGALMGCGGVFGGRRVLSEATVKAVLSRQTHVATEHNETQGLIFYQTSNGTSATRGRPIWGHNGGDPGASTDLFFTADGAVGLAVLTNSDAYGADAAVADGLSRLEQSLFEFAWTLPEPVEVCIG